MVILLNKQLNSADIFKLAMDTHEWSEVEKIMIEFGTLTQPLVSLEHTHIIHTCDWMISYDVFRALWKDFRNMPHMMKQYPQSQLHTRSQHEKISNELHEWYTKNLYPVFVKFIDYAGTIDETKPLYLCICTERGDEYIIRRSVAHDAITDSAFVLLNCEYSRMQDCIPRNKLSHTRESSNVDGEYLLAVIHKPIE